VILSGDLYHLRETRKAGRVPMVNVERADTLASMARIEKIIANAKARLIIQHDPQDFKALPKAPAFLE
jgi:N-acyl homoserine lactone hydrolase